MQLCAQLSPGAAGVGPPACSDPSAPLIYSARKRDLERDRSAAKTSWRTKAPTLCRRGTLCGARESSVRRAKWPLLGIDNSVGTLINYAAIERQGLGQGLEGDSQSVAGTPCVEER